MPPPEFLEMYAEGTHNDCDAFGKIKPSVYDDISTPSLGETEESLEGSSSYVSLLSTRVSFDLNKTTCKKIRSRHDMEVAEMEKVWYRAAEINDIQTWNRTIIRIFREHAKEILQSQESTCELDDDLGEHCIRGLEGRVNRRLDKKRNESKVAAIYSVLETQGRLRREGQAPDPELLAEKYRQHTVTTALECQKRGAKDHRASMEALRAPRHDAPVDGQHSPMALPERRRRTQRYRALDDTDTKAVQEELYRNSSPLPLSSPEPQKVKSFSNYLYKAMSSKFNSKPKEEKTESRVARVPERRVVRRNSIN